MSPQHFSLFVASSSCSSSSSKLLPRSLCGHTPCIPRGRDYHHPAAVPIAMVEHIIPSSLLSSYRWSVLNVAKDVTTVATVAVAVVAIVVVVVVEIATNAADFANQIIYYRLYFCLLFDEQ